MVKRMAKVNVAMNSIFPAVEPFICELLVSENGVQNFMSSMVITNDKVSRQNTISFNGGRFAKTISSCMME